MTSERPRSSSQSCSTKILGAYLGLMDSKDQLNITTFLPYSTPRKNPETLQSQGFSLGAPGRGRIHNLLIRSQTLYPVELRAHVRRHCDYSIRSAACQSIALPQGKGYHRRFVASNKNVTVASLMGGDSLWMERWDVRLENSS